MRGVKILSMGGTIDKIYHDQLSDFKVGSPQIEEILSDANVIPSIAIEEICRKDSLELTDQDRDNLLNAITHCQERDILITHGTDTMINTAQHLLTHYPTKLKEKIIVLVGSMTPAKFRSTDATFNVGFAMGALSALSPGVYITMNGQILTPNNAVKDRETMTFKPLDEDPKET